MDIFTFAFCKKMISDSISGLGNVFQIKGNKTSIDELPTSGNANGDVYLVGPKNDDSYDEYYWSSNNKWELMGTTATAAISDEIATIEDIDNLFNN